MIRLGIIGTGGMANMHAERFAEIKGVRLVAVCDVDREKAAAFAVRHEVPEVFGDFAEMLRKAGLDAVSIVTPDPSHAPLSLQAIAAGKHVLCEKPLATNAADADRMAAAAQEAGVINMVNFSYRNSPAWQKACSIVQSGELGRIFHFQAHYLQSWLSAADWGKWRETPAWLWRLSTNHGSHGALGDIGVHLLDFATGPIGSAEQVYCHLKTFAKAPDDRIGDYILDANDSAMITLECASGAVGHLSITRWATGHVNSLALSIHGERGALRLDLDKSNATLERSHLAADGTNQPWSSLECPPTPNIYQRFIQSIQSGTQDQPDFHRGAEVQHLLDACHRSAAEGRCLTL